MWNCRIVNSLLLVVFMYYISYIHTHLFFFALQCCALFHEKHIIFLPVMCFIHALIISFIFNIVTYRWRRRSLTEKYWPRAIIFRRSAVNIAAILLHTYSKTFEYCYWDSRLFLIGKCSAAILPRIRRKHAADFYHVNEVCGKFAADTPQVCRKHWLTIYRKPAKTYVGNRILVSTTFRHSHRRQPGFPPKQY